MNLDPYPVFVYSHLVISINLILKGTFSVLFPLSIDGGEMLKKEQHTFDHRNCATGDVYFGPTSGKTFEALLMEGSFGYHSMHGFWIEPRFYHVEALVPCGYTISYA